ncbi:PaaI family thioesterase [Croceicoccus sp. YJ47]|uniref:PaaI family thioesterase n=1 Tax=Croceicoccus sp. YJ47 TaxID=2798724 RepID=UPI0019227956|nr:PaaI family thioesterase [Croceicoccus sp. YJ47]QQN73568.1 PaaI family thioesterase [Croceicoccus sp. YJ47]
MAAHSPAVAGGRAPVRDADGWMPWLVGRPDEYNQVVLGPMHARREGESARVRMVPQDRHLNLNRVIHGGIILGFADVAIFAGASTVLDKDFLGGATVELNTQFVGPGDGNAPLDAVVEVVRETGRMVFARGLMVQGDATIASFSGIFRKPS